jgi:hypothetical protein
MGTSAAKVVVRGQPYLVGSFKRKVDAKDVFDRAKANRQPCEIVRLS